MSLTLQAEPGFTEIADATFNAGNPITATTAKALNADAKFAAVRTEEFWGYYKNGETVQLPVSPADGHVYAREDLRYTWSIHWTGAPPITALEGTQAPPTLGPTSGAGHLLEMAFLVDQATGLVTCRVDYHVQGGAQTNTEDGVLMVMTHAKRQR